MDEPPERDRPRWSFTWLLRLQRTGRTLPPGAEGRRRLIWQGVVLVIIGAILLAEIAVGLWLDVIPR